jgi:hypothetical protein
MLAARLARVWPAESDLEEGLMGADGAERGAFGTAAWADENRDVDGVWALERRRESDWVEVQRFDSREEAQQRLDEVAAETQTSLEDLRLVQIKK